MLAPDLTKHLVAHIREALAEDDRTNLLDVQVRIAAGRVFLLGQVGSNSQRSSAEEVAREIVPLGMTVVNELCVVTYSEPTDQERIP